MDSLYLICAAALGVGYLYFYGYFPSSRRSNERYVLFNNTDVVHDGKYMPDPQPAYDSWFVTKNGFEFAGNGPFSMDDIKPSNVRILKCKVDGELVSVKGTCAVGSVLFSPAWLSFKLSNKGLNARQAVVLTSAGKIIKVDLEKGEMLLVNENSLSITRGPDPQALGLNELFMQ